MAITEKSNADHAKAGPHGSHPESPAVGVPKPKQGKAEDPRAGAAVAQASDEDAEKAKLNVVVEPAVGEFSPTFAVISGIALLGVSAAVAMFFGRVITDYIAVLPDPTKVIAIDSTTMGTYSQATGFVAMLVLAALATILMVVGAYLASLEVRGRLRRRWRGGSVVISAAGDDPGELATKTIPADFDKVISSSAGLVEKFGPLRGTTAVIASALVVYVLAIVVFLAS